MISSPCRNCPNRRMPKDLCMQHCEEIQAIQQLQHTIHTPPYTCNEGSDIFPCRLASPMGTDE